MEKLEVKPVEGEIPFDKYGKLIVYKPTEAPKEALEEKQQQETKTMDEPLNKEVEEGMKLVNTVG